MLFQTQVKVSLSETTKILLLFSSLKKRTSSYEKVESLEGGKETWSMLLQLMESCPLVLCPEPEDRISVFFKTTKFHSICGEPSVIFCTFTLTAVIAEDEVTERL